MSDHLGAPAESFLPEAVREEDEPRLSARPFAFTKQPADQLMGSQDRKEAGYNRIDRHAQRIAGARHRRRLRQPAADVLDRRWMIAPGEKAAVEDCARNASRPPLPRLGDSHETIGIRPWQRLQQHAIGHAEEHRRRTDAERDGENRDGGEAWLPAQHTNRVAQILRQAGERGASFVAAAVFE